MEKSFKKILKKRIYSPWRMLSQAQVSTSLRYARDDKILCFFVILHIKKLLKWKVLKLVTELTS